MARERVSSAQRPTVSQRGNELPPDFGVWFEDHRGAVFRYVRFRLATREAAEDVTSEVFVKALRAFSRYDPKKASPRTWLLRIARNAVTDHLRALRRRGSLHVSLDKVPDLVSGDDSPEVRVVREARVQRILNAAGSLRKGDQDILSMRYGSGFSNHEIAEALSLSPNAVAVRLHRALGRLKQAIEHEEAEWTGSR